MSVGFGGRAWMSHLSVGEMTLLCISPSRVVQKLVMDWLLAKCLLCLSMKTYWKPVKPACWPSLLWPRRKWIKWISSRELSSGGRVMLSCNQLDSMPSAAAPKSAKELLARIIWCKHGRLVACKQLSMAA